MLRALLARITNAIEKKTTWEKTKCLKAEQSNTENGNKVFNENIPIPVRCVLSDALKSPSL